MERFNYSIIGCGNVAGDYEKKKKLKGIYTHGNAFSKIGYFNPLACIDIKIKKANMFKKKWKFKYASNKINFLNDLNNQLIIVSSNTSSHYKILSQIIKLKKKPKIVLCEKPLTNNTNKCKNIIKKFKKENIFLAINFHRRWDETTRKISYNIQKKLYGSLQGGYCIYNKGLLNTASHIIDLFIFFFYKFKITHVGKKNYDYCNKDPSIPFTLKINKSNINFLCMKNNKTNMLEIKLIFTKKIVETNDGGISWIIRPNKEKNILNYDFSFYKNKFFKKTYHNCFYNMAKNIYLFLYKDKKILSSGQNALEVHKYIKKIFLNAK